MFRDYRSMHFTRGGENDVALDEFGKHQLIDRSRRRVNPSQFFVRRNLLGTDRPGNDDLSIDDFFIHALVVGEVDDADFLKLLLQLFWEPSGSIPLVEGMMDEDQNADRMIG